MALGATVIQHVGPAAQEASLAPRRPQVKASHFLFMNGPENNTTCSVQLPQVPDRDSSKSTLRLQYGDEDDGHTYLSCRDVVKMTTG